MNTQSKVLDGLMGVCVGDALGVPVEFRSRDNLQKQPVTDMIGYGTYHQPPGTWSDDSSLTLCLADSLCNGYNLNDIGKKFVQWYHQNLWTPHGDVFDAGITTRKAIHRLHSGEVPVQEAGAKDENSNGNGSLMRILPLSFYLQGMETDQRFKIVADVSSITHGHIRSIISCCAYIEMAVNLLNGQSLKIAYTNMQRTIAEFYSDNEELRYLYNVIMKDISEFTKDKIRSSGYVVHTLEAALWCLLTSNSYPETVLKSVNLGEDTDTTGAVAGGLAGIYYGYENIPKKWIEQIARKDDIIELAERLARSLTGTERES